MEGRKGCYNPEPGTDPSVSMDIDCFFKYKKLLFPQYTLLVCLLVNAHAGNMVEIFIGMIGPGIENMNGKIVYELDR